MLVVYLVLLCSPFITHTVSQIPLQAAAAIGDEIWEKECKHSYEQLTWWKKGEQWASMGIGHFIWYPAGVQERYTQTFPEVLTYLHKHDVALPRWLYNKIPQPCPWSSETAFMADFQSPRMLELRSLLKNTTALQAQYIIEHFNDAMSTMLASLPPQKQQHVQQQINRLLTHSRGIYALIDYANFKGMGTNPQESYCGHGWGLLHVLTDMHGDSTGRPAVEAFAASAKKTVQQRVQHSPVHRNEQQWLAGWINRINTYTTQL